MEFRPSKDNKEEENLFIGYADEENNYATSIIFDKKSKLVSIKATGTCDAKSIINMMNDAVKLNSESYEANFDIKKAKNIIENIK